MRKASTYRQIISILTCFYVSSALTACSVQNSNDASSTSVTSSGNTPTAESQTQAGEPPSQLVGVKIETKCEDVISLQELYDFNPNFALDQSSPALSQEIANNFDSLKGLTCVYKNLTSGELIQLSLAKISDGSVPYLKQLLSESGQSAGSTSGSEASSFTSQDGMGTSQIILRNYWISVSSQSFLSSTDAEQFVAPLLNRL